MKSTRTEGSCHWLQPVCETIEEHFRSSFHHRARSGVPHLRCCRTKKKPLTGAWAVAALVIWTQFCICGSANAFGAWEHETISQSSLLVASNHASITFADQTNASERLRIMREIVSTFYEGIPEPVEPGKTNLPMVTYGEIAKLVDYMKDSYELLHQPQSRVNLPTDAKTSNLRYVRSLLKESQFVSLVNATHEDYNHFQGRGLDAFFCYHKLAVIAAAETNLWGALLLSAYASHFLEDAFAPGHLLTPRDINSHDLDSALLHDYYNEHGLIYSVERPQDLSQFAATAQALLATTSRQWPSQDGKTKHILNLATNGTDTFFDRLRNDSRVEVFCRGDGKLASTDQEAALLLMYCSRAIADVLESYVRGTATNSFPDYIWDRRIVRGTEEIEMQLPFGQLTCISDTKATPAIGVDSRSNTAPRGDQSGTNYHVQESLITPVYRNPGIIPSIGFESVSDFDGSHVRSLLEIEGLLAGGRLDLSGNPQQSANRRLPGIWGLTLGYSAVVGSDVDAQGAFCRGIWAIPPLNMQISGQLGGRYFWGEGGVEGLRDLEMLRIDWGLHIASIFVGMGHDSYSVSHKGLENGIAFEAGFSFAIPFSKLRHPEDLSD